MEAVPVQFGDPADVPLMDLLVCPAAPDGHPRLYVVPDIVRVVIIRLEVCPLLEALWRWDTGCPEDPLTGTTGVNVLEGL